MVDILLRTDLPKKAYRLRCRFTIEAYPKQEWLDRAKLKAAEMFVEDMIKQGWQYDPNKIHPNSRGFKLTGPYTATPITGLPKLNTIKRITNKEALARVSAGDPMRDTGEDWAVTLPGLFESNSWEYELSAVFIRTTILVETPSLHEEQEVLRNR